MNATHAMNTSIQADRTWQDAICTLIDACAAADAPFSSGELAKAVRDQRPDFRFAVTELGEFVKDLFHTGAIDYRDADAQLIPAIQVPRRTSGRSRTPANTEVFVYAPAPSVGLRHPFEVDIPRPGFTPTDLELKRFAAAAAQANAEMVATVHGDGRLCIPRRAFEELSHATGMSMRGADTVYLEVDPRDPCVRITLEAQPNTAPYNLSSERGRMRFAAPKGLAGFTAGARYPITIDDACLLITL